MKYQIIFFLLLFLVFSACQKKEPSSSGGILTNGLQNQPKKNETKTPEFANLQKGYLVGLVNNDQGRYLSGCGCYYWKPETKNISPFAQDKTNIKEDYLFIHDMGLPGRSWVMLNNQLINMYFGKKNTVKDDQGVPHMVDTFYQGDKEIKLDAIKTSETKDGVIHYKGIMTVKTSEGTEELSFLAQCGC